MHEHDECIRFLDQRLEGEDSRLLGNVLKPPPFGLVKVNTDGSFHEITKSMGVGGISRDDRGRWLRGFFSYADGGNALLAKAGALSDELRLAWDKGFRRVICEVDCTHLISSIDDEENKRFCSVFQEISVTGSRLECEFVRIPKDCNMAATFLAKWGSSLRWPSVHYLDSYFES